MRKIVLLLLVLASTASAGQRWPVTRTHYVITDRSRSPIYHVTLIEATDESHSSVIYLLRNVATGQKLQIDVETDYRSHEVTAEYVVDKQHSAKVRMQLPFIAARTLHETVAENKAHRELFKLDVAVTIEGQGRSINTTEKTWVGGIRTGDSRRKTRDTVDNTVSDAVMAAIPTLSFPDLSAACSSVSFVTDGAKCTGDATLMIAEVLPDCDFDTDFGLPCNADQASREKNAKYQGRNGRY
ncbi:MAG: hypothetical protein ABI837_13730 [Acidobacteriota bacterium]